MKNFEMPTWLKRPEDSEWRQSLYDYRYARGLDVARLRRIKKVHDEFRVATRTAPGHYIVKFVSGVGITPGYTCTCPDYAEFGRVSDIAEVVPCKHIFGVYFANSRQPLEAFANFRPLRPRYVPENEKAYRHSRKHEVADVTKLLDELFVGVPEFDRDEGPGRPRLSNHDVLLCAALKVFYGKSWDFMNGIYEQLNQLRVIQGVPSRATIGRVLAMPETTELLQARLGVAASPLMHLENDELNIDSSWIPLPTYEDLVSKKGEEAPPGRTKGLLKLHAATGPYTNVFMGALVYHSREAGSGDAPNLKPLLEQARTSGYHPRSVFADMAYSKIDNIEVIFNAKAFPYIPFKEPSVAAKPNSDNPESWNLLLDVFKRARHSFLQRYNRRQNVEATFSAVKRFFGRVRNRTYRTQVNEVLLMAVVYNVKRVNYFMHLLGITPIFDAGLKMLSDAAAE